MKKENAKNLLNMQLFDYNDTDALAILLDLSDDEVEFIQNKFNEMGEKWVLNYVEIITNKILYDSPYYDYVKDILKNIGKEVYLETLKDLILDSKLINSNYYKKVMELALSLDKVTLSYFIDLATNSNLFNKTFYIDVINGFFSVNNQCIYVNVFTNKNFVECDICLDVLNQYLNNPFFESAWNSSEFRDIMLINAKEPNFTDVYNFLIEQSENDKSGVAFEVIYDILCEYGFARKKYCMDLLKIVSKYNNYDEEKDYYSLEMFRSFLKNPEFMNSDYCCKILSLISDLKNQHALELVKYFCDSGYDKNSKYNNNLFYIYKISIEKSECFDSETLNKMLDVFVNPKYTDGHFMSIYHSIMEINDNNLANVFCNLVDVDYIIKVNKLYICANFIDYVSYLDLDVRDEKCQTLLNLLKNSDDSSIEKAIEYMLDVVRKVSMNFDKICANNKVKNNYNVLNDILSSLESNCDDNITSDIIKCRKK